MTCDEGSPKLSLDDFAASLHDRVDPVELAAFVAGTREEARHDPTFGITRTPDDWGRELIAWRLQQQLLRRGAFSLLTKAQLKELGVECESAVH